MHRSTTTTTSTPSTIPTTSMSSAGIESEGAGVKSCSVRRGWRETLGTCCCNALTDFHELRRTLRVAGVVLGSAVVLSRVLFPHRNKFLHSKMTKVWLIIPPVSCSLENSGERWLCGKCSPELLAVISNRHIQNHVAYTDNIPPPHQLCHSSSIGTLNSRQSCPRDSNFSTRVCSAMKGTDLSPFILYTLDLSPVDLLHHRPGSQLKPLARSNLGKTKRVASLIENCSSFFSPRGCYCLASPLVPSALHLCCSTSGSVENTENCGAC